MATLRKPQSAVNVGRGAHGGRGPRALSEGTTYCPLAHRPPGSQESLLPACKRMSPVTHTACVPATAWAQHSLAGSHSDSDGHSDTVANITKDVSLVLSAMEERKQVKEGSGGQDRPPRGGAISRATSVLGARLYLFSLSPGNKVTDWSGHVFVFLFTHAANM